MIILICVLENCLLISFSYREKEERSGQPTLIQDGDLDWFLRLKKSCGGLKTFSIFFKLNR